MSDEDLVAQNNWSTEFRYRCVLKLVRREPPDGKLLPRSDIDEIPANHEKALAKWQ